MSFLTAAPEELATAATDLAGIGSRLSEANAAAEAATIGVLRPGADEVSAVITALFDGYGRAYQTWGAQAAAFHQQFLQALSAGAGSYADAEAAAASVLQRTQQQVVNLDLSCNSAFAGVVDAKGALPQG